MPLGYSNYSTNDHHFGISIQSNTNGQKPNGIFNSYQNSDSFGFCPLVPTIHPITAGCWSVLSFY